MRYAAAVSRNRVVKEKVFSLKRDEYPKIQIQIAARGWSTLCAQPTVAYQKLVKEFYANAFRVDGDTLEKFHIVVRDIEIDFSAKKMREFLGISYSAGRTSDFHSRWVVNHWDPDEVLSTICVPSA